MRFLFFAPTVQLGKYGAVLTLETLGKRWGWEKTKVWRFFRKYNDMFDLYRLPGSYGCLVFNKLYPCDTECVTPSQEQIMRILDAIRAYAVNTTRERQTINISTGLLHGTAGEWLINFRQLPMKIALQNRTI